MQWIRGGALVVEHLMFDDRFFFNDTATTEIYTLSLHDALPISKRDVDVILPTPSLLLVLYLRSAPMDTFLERWLLGLYKYR